MRILHLLNIILFCWLPSLLIGQDTLVTTLKLNSRYNEFAPALYKDGIVFCSDRPSQFAISWVDANGNSPSKIYCTESKDDKNAFLFSEQLSSKTNESAACFTSDGNEIIYTGTITTQNSSEQGRFGLFFSKLVGESWSEPTPFDHNSKNNSYSVAHPSISQDGRRLFFASDMEGGFGGKDIYYSEKVDGIWSTPINLGEKVNSSFNEVFPHITTDSKLYFSSDRGGEATGLDIYTSQWNDSWTAPNRVPSPINSERDDFALIMNQDNTSGYFSSGRNGRNDDIFSFSINYPTFDGCQTAELPMFCYCFEETNLVPNDTMPLIFEWEFGDGTKAKGINAEHCYKDFGTYHVALNVYDSLTRVHFAKVSEIDVVIAKSPFPFIHSDDILTSVGEMLFSAEGTDIADFTPEEYYWDSGHGQRSKGFNTAFTYKENGFYTVQLGIIGKNKNGESEKRCAIKRIKVGDVNDTESLATRESVLQNEMVFSGNEKLTPSKDTTLYYVEFKESDTQIPLNDDYFDDIKYEITERYDEKEILYKYSVGETTDMGELVKIYKDLVEHGYNESIVKEEKTATFNNKTTNTWWYMPDSIATAINRHVNKFNEIRFDLGTFTIRTESYDNLNYISKVLSAEKTLRLRIHAHTDNVGNDDSNLILSQKRADSVISYLVGQGVEMSRLEAIGHGEDKPVSTNQTEMGRSQNRRVEFEILFPSIK